MADELHITTGARLHFGLWSLRPADRRHFGGMGMMIDGPRVRVTVSAAATTSVDAPTPLARRRAAKAIDCLSHSASNARPMRLIVHEEIPPHQGLGSGTQLELAVATAWDRWNGRQSSTVELAAHLKRGRRSAIGVHGFQRGGLLVDGGRENSAGDCDIAPLLARIEIPEAWRIVLALPPADPGLSGGAEERAFDLLPAIPPAATDALCGLALTRVLPAAATGDFREFSEGVSRYGAHAGQAFAAVQGGIYAGESTAALVGRFREMNVSGVGQSSWGPGVFAFFECEDAAVDAIKLLREQADQGTDYRICRPRNVGTTAVFA